jgi:hypothetical protein
MPRKKKNKNKKKTQQSATNAALNAVNPKALNKDQRRRLDHMKAVKRTHDPNFGGSGHAAAMNADQAALPPRTAHYDKRTGTQKSEAVKVGETNNEVTYAWTEDRGGENVHVKKRSYFKDHAKAQYENDWTSDHGNHCKINKEKFDEGYKEIFGEEKKGAASGTFKRFKKTY